MTDATVPNPTAVLSVREGLRYGLLGFPLAFCALPLYVLMPNLYAREWGVPLATLGALLLAARLLDAVVDPWLGRLSDRLFARSLRSVLVFGAVAAAVLAVGFSLLFIPLVREPTALVVWAGVCLLITYLGYSALTVAHQSWGAMLGGDARQRSHIVAWREGLGLVGVVLAAVIPAWLGVPAMLCLLVVYLLNGIASAIPATLVLFFVQDRLQGSAALQSASLGIYFVCAAMSMPLWLKLVARVGLQRSWLTGMALSIAVFLGAALLGTGDSAWFLVVCALSGLALGSDLALPGALLAGVIADAGDRGKSDGTYFGWWNLATKLNLALAAGVALPLLGWLGYAPGARGESALQVLTFAYCLLPCALKALAASALYFLMIQPAARLGKPL